MNKVYKTILSGECVSTKRQTHHTIKLSVLKRLIKKLKNGRTVK